jgi:hypothetical protein
MEYTAIQIIIDIIIGVAGFFGVWILNRITATMDRLDADVRKMPEKYVTKDDFHRDIDEIKEICKQIFDKLDNKADK